MKTARRDYCRCTTVQNHDYDEAASLLKCARRWLEDNISRLPHQKRGKAVAFCPCELVLIQGISTVLPEGLLDEETPAESTPSSEHRSGLASIKPSQGRRRAAA